MIVGLVVLALVIGVVIAFRVAPRDDDNDDDDGPGPLRRIRVPVEARAGPRSGRRNSRR